MTATAAYLYFRVEKIWQLSPDILVWTLNAGGGML